MITSHQSPALRFTDKVRTWFRLRVAPVRAFGAPDDGDGVSFDALWRDFIAERRAAGDHIGLRDEGKRVVFEAMIASTRKYRVFHEPGTGRKSLLGARLRRKR